MSEGAKGDVNFRMWQFAMNGSLVSDSGITSDSDFRRKIPGYRAFAGSSLVFRELLG